MLLLLAFLFGANASGGFGCESVNFSDDNRCGRRNGRKVCTGRPDASGDLMTHCSAQGFCGPQETHDNGDTAHNFPPLCTGFTDEPFMLVSRSGLLTCRGDVDDQSISQPCAARRGTSCDLDTCKSECMSNGECNFFYFNEVGTCIMYRRCAAKRIPNIPGQTFQRSRGDGIHGGQGFGCESVNFSDDNRCGRRNGRKVCTGRPDASGDLMTHCSNQGFCGTQETHDNQDTAHNFPPLCAGFTDEPFMLVSRSGLLTCRGDVDDQSISQPCAARRGTSCDLDTCKSECISNEECNFFYFNEVGTCIMYRRCAAKRIPNIPGQTFQRTSPASGAQREDSLGNHPGAAAMYFSVANKTMHTSKATNFIVHFLAFIGAGFSIWMVGKQCSKNSEFQEISSEI